MAAGPLTIKLRVASWAQLESIYKRDLARSAVFLRSSSPPPVGTQVRINLTLPSETLIILGGEISEHIPPGGLDGRGPGVDVRLQVVPQSAMWLIESALATARKQQGSGGGQPSTVANDQAIPRRKRPPTAPPAAAIPPPGDEASLEDGAGLVEAEASLVSALASELATLRPLNPFQVLGVGYEAGDQQVRDAFGSLTKRYHPDRFARFQSREAREHASEIFILLRDAYRQIGTGPERARTLRVLRARGEGPPGAMTPMEEAAAGAVARAPAPAPAPRPPVRPAASPPAPPPAAPPAAPPSAAPPVAAPPPATPPPAEPGRPAPGMASAATMIEQGRYEDASAVYNLVLRRNPGDRAARAGVELCEGLKALAQRDRMNAAQRFEAVLELDPDNERAARELADMRRQATNDRKGLLARLLGKKE